MEGKDLGFLCGEGGEKSLGRKDLAKDGCLQECSDLSLL